MEIQIAGRAVGDGHPAYIVAEVGQNHNGDVYAAVRLCAMAAKAGCDAVKFCKRDLASELTSEAAARPYDNCNSFGATYGEHRAALEFSEEEYQHLKRRIEYNEWPLAMFATACDIPSVDLLEHVGVPAYKVASRDIDNHPLLDRIAATRKPVILSTGMSDLDEIGDALGRIWAVHRNVVVLHCTSAYPTSNEDVNLRAMQTLRDTFGVLVGLSDHTPGIVAAQNAVALGACVIEKHITFSRAAKGTDHAGSLEQAGVVKLVENIRITEQQLGSPEKVRLASVGAAERKLRRSLVSAVDIPAGCVVDESAVCLKSPGTGVGWRNRASVIGRRARVDIPADTTIKEGWLE